MTMAKLTKQYRKPQNQIVGRNLSRTAKVKKELLQALLIEQSQTQPALEVPTKKESVFERMLRTIRSAIAKR